MEILYAIAIIVGLFVGIANWLNRPSRGKFERLGDIRGKSLERTRLVNKCPVSYRTS